MTVNVTEYHIVRGIRGNSEKCPVGLALAAHGRNVATAKLSYETKLIVFGFMEDFDKQREVQPFLFEVE